MSSAAATAERRSFGRQVMRAIAWRSGSQMVAQAIMWAATFFVIRILDPGDYGLFAMTQSVLVFLSLLNGQEFAVALIRAPEISRLEIRQTFGILVALNGLMALAQLAVAPLAAAYFGHQIVQQLLTVQALIYLANPLIVLPSALLSREMNYEVQAKVNLASALAGAAVSLAGALAGLGVWTLVAAPLVNFWVRAIGMTVAARLVVLPSFSFRGASAHVKLGGAMLLSSLFWLVQTQADVVIAGRVIRPHFLGLYTEALFLAQIITAKVIPPLNDVAFSAYARLQDDRAGTAFAFEKSVRLIMVIALPFYAGLAVTAPAFVAVVLGDKWLEAVPIVRLLACAMPFMTLQVLFAPATTALGDPRPQVRAAAAGAVIFPLAFLIGVRGDGIGLALAWIAGAPALLAVTAAMSMRLIGTSPLRLWRAIEPPLLAAIGMAALVVIADETLPQMDLLPRLVLMVITGVAGYAAMVMLVGRELIRDGIELVRLRRGG